MKFDNILSDTECNCLEDSFEDTTNIYAKKLINTIVTINDFTTKWENGIRKSENCEDICKLKGLSINIYNEMSKNKVREKYLNMHKTAPKYITIPVLCTFRLLIDSGKIKYTPKNDKYHYTFYKCDEFNMDKINILEVFLL